MAKTMAMQPRLYSTLYPPTITRRKTVMAKAKEVLIVSTNSGGHAIIGFWLARDLEKSGHQVTIFTAGEEASAKMTKPPFSRFSDIVKIDASHVVVEDYIRSLSFDSLAIFRPQYMIGSGNNKDCEEWFFDRIVRDRPVPIPGSGMQVTNIVHVKDLASMLALAVQKPFAANGNIFNAVCDRAITFDGLVKLCARAAGKEADIVHYDPKSINIDAKKAFPFRNMHFYAEPRAAKEILGWQSTTNLLEDLKERFEEYIAIGRDKKDMKFDLDDKILESSR
ncbi:hypothetical protein KI387_009600, partial [Taxus chinensis]